MRFVLMVYGKNLSPFFLDDEKGGVFSGGIYLNEEVLRMGFDGVV
ncbi:MAG: hypothetical protein ACJA0S_001204 [Rickettsiales bacterium]|jgi:hypothetical protein